MNERPMGKFLLLIVGAIVFMLICLIIGVLCETAKADSTKVFWSTDDAYLRELGTTYLDVRNDADASYRDYTTTIHRVGQVYDSPNYYIPRSYCVVDLSAIPDGDVIDSAFIGIYIDADYSTTDFDITIVEGLWSADPPVSTDYETGVKIGEVSGGSLSTSGMSSGNWYRIEFNATGLGWISKTGTTRLCLRSSRDLSATVPTGDEQIQHRSANWSVTTYDPYVVAYHTTGAPAAGQVIIID